MWLTAAAQDELPSVTPVMHVTGDALVDEAVESYAGNAPMYAVFRACPEHLGAWTPLYEWRFTKAGEQQPFLVRYDEDTDYHFRESGTFTVELRVSFVQGTDTIEFEQDAPFTVNINESRLEVPNAFSPNGDGINDVFRVKDGYQSIVSFKARVFSRWGKKLYEWTDLAGGWDGRSAGNACPDGAYYLVVEARGADGRNYHIKKTINLLRGFQENDQSID